MVTQRMGLYVIVDTHPGIMAAMTDVHLGWIGPDAYHRICMRHLADNFMNLECRATLANEVGKFNKHMNTIGRINLEAQ